MPHAGGSYLPLSRDVNCADVAPLLQGGEWFDGRRDSRAARSDNRRQRLRRRCRYRPTSRRSRRTGSMAPVRSRHVTAQNTPNWWPPFTSSTLDRRGADRRGRIGHSSRRREDRHARDGGDRRGSRRRDRALAPAQVVIDPVMVAKSGDRLFPTRTRSSRARLAAAPLCGGHARIATKPRCLRACQCAPTTRPERRRAALPAAARPPWSSRPPLRAHTSSTCCSTGATSPRSRASASTRRARTAPAARSPPRIAAHLACGRSLPDAVQGATEHVAGAIRNAVPLGHGHGPVIISGKERNTDAVASWPPLSGTGETVPDVRRTPRGRATGSVR